MTLFVSPKQIYSEGTGFIMSVTKDHSFQRTFYKALLIYYKKEYVFTLYPEKIVFVNN